MTLTVVPYAAEATDPGLTGPLGCGVHRAFVYDRGGMLRLGEIMPLAQIQWNRVRDDISACTLVTAGFGPDCCDLMGSLHAMRHELVVYRSGVRVWEGPITRIAFYSDHVEMDAHDVMYYVQRRIMREGYDDRSTKKPGTGQPPTTNPPVYINHTRTVVEVAVSVTKGVLARDDPNVSRYVTRFDRPDDAREARHILPYQKTAWEEIDDLAANSGLDYTVMGRRIMFWDTHNAIGRLPAWGDDTFLSAPVITEYGSELATLAAVTDGLGHYATAGGKSDYYGYVESLNSSYSSKGPPATAKDLAKLQKNVDTTHAAFRDALSSYLKASGLSHAQAVQLHNWYVERAGHPLPARQQWLDAHIKALQDKSNAKAALKTQLDHARKAYQDAVKALGDAQDMYDEYMKSLRQQAHRALMGKHPAPILVRVPDNSQLSPDIDVGINELVPGVWVPLRSRSTCKELTQWQKIDSITVLETPDQGEQVTVVLGQAPDHGRDPIDVSADDGG